MNMFWEPTIQLSSFDPSQEYRPGAANDSIVGLGLSFNAIDPSLHDYSNPGPSISPNETHQWQPSGTSQMMPYISNDSNFLPYALSSRNFLTPQSLDSSRRDFSQMTPVDTPQEWHGWDQSTYEQPSPYSSPNGHHISSGDGDGPHGGVASLPSTPWSHDESYPTPTPCGPQEVSYDVLSTGNELQKNSRTPYTASEPIPTTTLPSRRSERLSTLPTFPVSSPSSRAQSEVPEEKESIKKKKNLICKTCGLKFDGKGSLRLHSRSHSAKRKQVQCPSEGCKKTYGRQADLSRHIRSFHKKEMYPCQHCGKRFNRTDIRNRHVVDSCPTRREKFRGFILTPSTTYVGSQYSTPWPTPIEPKFDEAVAYTHSDQL